MLQELHIENFAIIDSLHLSFMKGFNILSGETGAGKSIIAGALGLLMGGRASAELIRTAKDEAVVEAVFDISANKPIHNLLSSFGIEVDDTQLLIRRTITKTGKNRIFIAKQLATIQMLTQVGGNLIDISGQYSQQLLLQVDRHVDILDDFAGLTEIRSNYHDLYRLFLEKARQLQSILNHHDELMQQKELLSFQNEEIEKAHLSPDEEEELIKERSILSNAQNLYEKTYGAYTVLYEDDHACLTVLKRLLRDLEDCSKIDADLLSHKENLASSMVNLEDIAYFLRSYAEKIHMDPDKLDSVEHRLDEIVRLKKKYGASISEILSFQKNIQNKLENMTFGSQKVTELQEELCGIAEKLWVLAEKLSEKRKKAGTVLSKRVQDELAGIGMKKARFIIDIISSERQPGDAVESGLQGLTDCGKDKLEFYISTNIGEEPKPLSKIASGGEISRIVLAIKKLLAGNYRVPTLLFDEVDSGIGGAIAETVGIKLKEIADSHQVLCITHLPQIACFGDYHYNVSKHMRGGRTETSVELLDNNARLNEIARMVGGKSISEKTRAYAREMLKNAGQN